MRLTQLFIILGSCMIFKRLHNNFAKCNPPRKKRYSGSIQTRSTYRCLHCFQIFRTIGYISFMTDEVTRSFIEISSSSRLSGTPLALQRRLFRLTENASCFSSSVITILAVNKINSLLRDKMFHKLSRNHFQVDIEVNGVDCFSIIIPQSSSIDRQYHHARLMLVFVRL